MTIRYLENTELFSQQLYLTPVPSPKAMELVRHWWKPLLNFDYFLRTFRLFSQILAFLNKRISK
jgi:hypothetical protein